MSSIKEFLRRTGGLNKEGHKALQPPKTGKKNGGRMKRVITKDESEFLESYRATLNEKTRNLLWDDENLLVCIWSEIDFTAGHFEIEIPGRETASGNPEMLAIPHSWVERFRQEEAAADKVEGEIKWKQ